MIPYGNIIFFAVLGLIFLRACVVHHKAPVRPERRNPYQSPDQYPWE